MYVPISTLFLLSVIKLNFHIQDKTEVKTRDGASEFTYCLDEGLVEFGTAVNDNDFGRAILFLETLGDVPAAKAMWHNLANVALSQQNILVKKS